jgi:hypothetical protein
LVHSITPPFWKVNTNVQVEVVLDPGPNQRSQSSKLEEFLESHPPRIILDSGASIQENILSTPRIQNKRFAANEIHAKDWTDTDLKKETDPPRKEKGFRFNVTQKAIRIVQSEYRFAADDLFISDDRAHEVADLVLIESGDKTITFFLLNYKVSPGKEPGFSRLDLSELADQAVRTGHWIRSPRLMERLKQRVASGSKILHGDLAQLKKLANDFRPDEWTYWVVIVQPGLSRDILLHQSGPSQAEQLLLMLRDRITADYGASFSVWTSV